MTNEPIVPPYSDAVNRLSLFEARWRAEDFTDALLGLQSVVNELVALVGHTVVNADTHADLTNLDLHAQRLLRKLHEYRRDFDNSGAA